jgi:hypothetical protein
MLFWNLLAEMSQHRTRTSGLLPRLNTLAWAEHDRDLCAGAEVVFRRLASRGASLLGVLREGPLRQ